MNEIKKEGLERVLKRHEDNVSNIQAIVSRMIETGFTISTKELYHKEDFTVSDKELARNWAQGLPDA